MTLRDQIANDVENVLLNVNEMSEQLVYRPKDGTPRTIVGNVDENADYVQVSRDLDKIETLVVFVRRDSEAGIDNPQLGDAISRVIDGTGQNAKWYSYQGTGNQVFANDWELVFLLDTVTRHGGFARQ